MATESHAYSFPETKLRRSLKDPHRKPLVLVACGSFSPITYLHLRMFEMACDHARVNTDFEVVGCYLSPVSDAYKKKGLASAEDRLKMCDMAVERTSSLTVDPWEALKPEYTPTLQVLDHLDHEINEVRGGVEVSAGKKEKAQVSLLAGADLIDTFFIPGVWAEVDLDRILGRYGAFVVERSGTDLALVLSKLKQPTDKIHVVVQEIRNDVSSTKIRDFISRGLSIQYLVPPEVVAYIEGKRLYQATQP